MKEKIRNLELNNYFFGLRFKKYLKNEKGYGTIMNIDLLLVLLVALLANPLSLRGVTDTYLSDLSISFIITAASYILFTTLVYCTNFAILAIRAKIVFDLVLTIRVIINVLTNRMSAVDVIVGILAIMVVKYLFTFEEFRDEVIEDNTKEAEETK